MHQVKHFIKTMGSTVITTKLCYYVASTFGAEGLLELADVRLRGEEGGRKIDNDVDRLFSFDNDGSEMFFLMNCDVSYI